MSSKHIGANGCRLHYWFQGAPEDRIGGPWSYMVFYDKPGSSAHTQRLLFLESLKPFLYRAAFSEAADPLIETPEHRPPPDALEVECGPAIDWSKDPPR